MRAIVTTLLFGLGLGVYMVGPPRLARADDANACGCYHDDSGACRCVNKRPLKCDCPNDCEPVGCEAKRLKDANRDAEAALKKIQAREKKRSADAARESKAKARTAAKATKKDEAKDKESSKQSKDALNEILGKAK